MEIEDSLRYGPLSWDKLEEFEDRYQLTIPPQYRDFLLKHNGGSPVPDTISFPDGSNTSSIRLIYGIHNGPYWSTLDWAFESYLGSMPEEFIPFGEDPMGNVFIIAVKGNDLGKIYFWDHELASDQQPWYENLTWLADSFNEFLEMLYQWVDPNETEEERIMRTNDVEGFRKLISRPEFDIHKKDHYNRTILENATIWARHDMIEILVSMGADCSEPLKIAESNLELFPESGYQRIIELFKGSLNYIPPGK
jgi:hypothetical protein